MPKPTTAFLPLTGQAHTRSLANQLAGSGLVRRIYLLAAGAARSLPGCHALSVDSLHATATVQAMAANISTPAPLFLLSDPTLELGPSARQRLLGARSTAFGRKTRSRSTRSTGTSTTAGRPSGGLRTAAGRLPARGGAARSSRRSTNDAAATADKPVRTSRSGRSGSARRREAAP